MPLFASKKESSVKSGKLSLVATAVAAALAFAAFPVQSIGAPTAAYAAKSGATKAAAAPPSVNFKTLYTFTGGADGAGPNGPLLRDTQGNLYGVTGAGGNAPGCTVNYGCGVVFMIDPSGSENVLYAFRGGTDGWYPVGNLFMDAQGNLYGVTTYGGVTSCVPENGCGVIFKLSPPATKGMRWKETIIKRFTGGKDGALPYAGLIPDGKGNAYGTTSGGGLPARNRAGGIIFKIDQFDNETVLYKFCSKYGAFGNCFDGESPFAAPTLGADGNLYGTTFDGGFTQNDFGSGIIYKLTPSGGKYRLYNFCSVGNCSDGAHPEASVLADAQGNVYGTTPVGGTGPGCCGIVFKVDSSGAETVLHSFAGGADGAYPSSGTLFRDAQGNLYGTTYGGGSGSCTTNGGPGCGTIFKVTANGEETVVYTFMGTTDGAFPAYGLITDGKGHAYGTTSGGEQFPYGYGTVFEISQ